MKVKLKRFKKLEEEISFLRENDIEMKNEVE